MSMMHGSNEINCFSWITNLISKQPPLKQSPTQSTQIRTKERGEGSMREKVEREGTLRERRERGRPSRVGKTKSDVLPLSHVFI